jgi:cold shock CspA family protein
MDKNYVEDSKLIASLEKHAPFYIALVTQYDDKRGFGFVYIDGQRIFVHISNVKNGKLYNGIKIQFKIEDTDRGKQAVDISIIN